LAQRPSAHCPSPIRPSPIRPFAHSPNRADDEILRVKLLDREGQTVRSKTKSESVLESERSGVHSKIFIGLDIHHLRCHRPGVLRHAMLENVHHPIRPSPMIAHRPFAHRPPAHSPIAHPPIHPSPIAHRPRPPPIAHRPFAHRQSPIAHRLTYTGARAPPGVQHRHVHHPSPDRSTCDQHYSSVGDEERR